MANQSYKMTQRTFGEDAPWPPLKPGTLRLYSMRFCPYAQRARLVLAHKNIPYETVNVHLKHKPPWLLERNPKGRVPILEHPDGRFIFESVVVCNYLDEIYTHNRLVPIDPYQKARDLLLVDFCDKFMKAMYLLLFNNGTSDEADDVFQKGFRLYEGELKKRLPNGPFLGGDKPAMVDYLVWPWFERIPMMDGNDLILIYKDDPGTQSRRMGISSSLHPLLHRWMTAMYSLPAVKETMFDFQAHMRFSRHSLTGDPEYDVGLEDEPPLPHLAAKL